MYLEHYSDRILWAIKQVSVDFSKDEINTKYFSDHNGINLELGNRIIVVKFKRLAMPNVSENVEQLELSLLVAHYFVK